MINVASDRIGFFAPLLAFAPREGMTYRVFAPLTRRGRLRNPNNPLSAFRSSPESHSHQSRLLRNFKLLPAIHHVTKHLPCGFNPFDVFPAPGSHITLEATNLQLLPSQRFSRSQGLTPPGTCRPCFMPVPSLGFYPPGFIPPAEPYVLSNAFALMWLAQLPVSAPTPLPFQATQAVTLHAHGAIIDAAPWKQAPLQGLAPRECPYSRSVV
jgi:hypothetical protein